ncbi:MAG: bifunctional diguanylate cyclase/phosphodiesterase [Caulobacter sp.]|nr:bifunctional diguanylate cyclase/phosphodiesterase [Caulobacter sp.]
MTPGATAGALAPTDVPPAAIPAGATPVFVVRPGGEPAGEVTRVLRLAYPDVTPVILGSGAEAASRSGEVACFDFLGLPLPEIGQHLRAATRTASHAEIVVFLDGADRTAVSACLTVTASPERMTFLVAPFDAAEAAATLRTVALRARTGGQARSGDADRDAIIRRLEVEVMEVQARLDVALHVARHDALTGLPNRAGFVGELTSRLANGFQSQTVFLINIDRFKLVNETLGHEAGDDLIRKIGVALATVTPANGLLARLGGDEFGVVTESLSEQGIADFCKLLLRVCAQSRRVYGHEVQVSICIGVCVQKPDQDNGDLLRQADLALRAAKREGRNRYRVYDEEIAQTSVRRLTLESGLERALRAGEFAMVYQPIVDARSCQILGYEALVRWNSPQFGPVSPADFIPVAEETGLMLELGDWILRQAMKDCRRWGGPYVSINLSARQFLYQKIGDRILQYAQDCDLPAARIQVELTETAIIDDVERASENLRVLREAGVRVALDDFGTGYSSLTYLQRFDIDCIKIDKSFVDDITTDRESAMIVASVTRLAKALGMSVVAEGVETEPQRQVLLAAGCDYLQGYHYGRPIAPGEIAVALGQPPADV